MNTLEFIESGRQSITPDSSELDYSSPKTGSSATHNFCCVYWFHKLIVGYMDHIEPVEVYSGLKRPKDV